MRCFCLLEFFLLQVKPEKAEAQESFTYLELRGVMKFLLLQGKSVMDIHTDTLQTLLQKCHRYSTVKTWIFRLKTGNFSVEDEPRSGRPQTATDTATCNAVHEQIFEDRRITAKKDSRDSGHLSGACRIYYYHDRRHVQAFSEVSAQMFEEWPAAGTS